MAATSGFSYHVFLSFRGEDTRKTFVDHLYIALMNAGFRTFKDDEEINRGEHISSELRTAIEQSRSSIIVFSKDYASSKWCLDELRTILEHKKKTSGHILLPVFYDVDPTEVRNQTGSFVKAFAMHEQRFKREIDGMDTVEGWRAALREVANLTGMHLRNETDGHEAKFIQKIVTVIRDKLNRTVVNVESYIVGMQSRIKNINSWLQDGSINVGLFAVCGMGGVGKTTIAKFVYNLNYQRFEGSSFLEVREILEKPNGLDRLLRKLRSDILPLREKIRDIDEGIIKESLNNKRVLIVFDDVHKEDQMDAVLRMRNWLAPGSKIIITTRQKQLLIAREIDMVQTVETLNDNESSKLFNWHAFGQEHPIGGYTEQAKRGVEYSGGLPLALQILGSSLSGQSVVLWKSKLDKIKAIFESRILEKLKISYDSLQDEHDRNLFLHIACFFIGKDKDWTIMILEECDYFIAIGIQNLVDRCVLTIDENNKLRMHQLLRDMAREIIRQESPMDPGEHKRLWGHNALHVLREKTGTETIEGIVLDMGDSTFNTRKYHFGSQGNSNEVDLEINTFRKMHKLRLLQLKSVHFNDDGGYEEFPKGLRWLCWHRFHRKYIPSNFPLESLVALDMCRSSLELVWKETKRLPLLKFLDLSHSHFLVKTPDFSALPNLESLILKHCTSLGEVHETIGNLKRLVFLNLKGCKILQTLPRNIYAMKCLETLIISGCSKLQRFPGELSKMESLKVLHLDEIAMNRIMPSAGKIESRHAITWPRVSLSMPRICALSCVSKQRIGPEISWASLPTNLVSLSLAGCSLSEVDFPREFSNISSLQHLNLSKNPIFSLPNCISHLTKLQTLAFESCTRLQLLEGLPSVKKLNVSNCMSLEKITFLSTMFRLQEAAFDGCSNLVEVQGWFKLEPFERIDPRVINFLGLHDFKTMANLKVNLANGLLGVCPKIYSIQGLHEFGICSLFFPGIEVPGTEVPRWFNHTSRGSSVSFTMPSSPEFSIQGLNVSFVYALENSTEDNNSKALLPHPLFIKISNKTKGLKWIYGPSCFGIPKGDERMIWLAHWKLGNHLEGGDEVSVSMLADAGFQVEKCGVRVVFEQEENRGTQHNNPYSCGPCVIGGDLSEYHLTKGVYFLCNQALPMVYDSSSSVLYDYLFQDSDESAGIRPELGAEDRLALIGLEDCHPEKYSDLIKHSVLTKLGFNPPEVTVETSIPISVVGAEEVAGSSSIGPSLEALRAKVNLLRRGRSGEKRKAEVGSGSDSVPLAKVQRIEVPPASPHHSQVVFTPPPSSSKVARTSVLQETLSSSSGGVPEQAGPLVSPSSIVVEGALESVAHILCGPPPPRPVEKIHHLQVEGLKVEKGKGSLIENTRLATEAIASIIPESDIQKVTAMPLSSCVTTALYGATSLAIHMSALTSRIRALESSTQALKASELKIAELVFSNDDLKARVQELQVQVERLSSANKDLEAEKGEAEDEVKKTKEELKLKTGEWVKACKDAFEALESYEAMKREYAILAKVNDTFHREIEVESAAVKKKDALIAKLEDDVTTKWAIGYLAFQDQAMQKYPDLDFEFDPPSD